ncbi:hypothetical protein SCHPADRAFT_716782 [Schizopora paradoxa]|uniref:Uncharacterized protein n=1 Tax=Schizopora paradoxa TaxID=27342 RepID=A0A0H2R2V0_9AGAM|nr:hypothetical protein SCHPADRAFT_716782 [Schizopora paradoxa]
MRHRPLPGFSLNRRSRGSSSIAVQVFIRTSALTCGVVIPRAQKIGFFVARTRRGRGSYSYCGRTGIRAIAVCQSCLYFWDRW